MASFSPQPHMRVEMVSAQKWKVVIRKSYRPPMRPLISNNLAWLPPLAPDTMISVVAVASGNGYLPCMSETKYLRNGIRNRMPKKPPKSEERKICQKLTCISAPNAGLVSLMM